MADSPAAQRAADRWVSIRRAAEILGVNEATLRSWSDAGKLRTFTTPGGHRRFSEEDLRSLTDAPGARAPGPALAEILLGSRERYEALARRCLAGNAWFASFDDAARRRFRILGGSMLGLVCTYLTGGRRERERSLAEGLEIATEYGAEAARLGLSLPEATEAFLLFERRCWRASTGGCATAGTPVVRPTSCRAARTTSWTRCCSAWPRPTSAIGPPR